MGIYLNPGNRMFQTMLNSKFYVDKTGIASFMNERVDSEGRFVAVSRPRRFGKSVDANMLVAYYSRGCDSRAQFEGLDVSRDPSFDAHLNAHDVIRVDVQRMIGRRGIERIMDTIEERVMEELRDAWPGALPARPLELPAALDRVFEAKGSGFVFVIDEWDCPMREAADDEALQRRWLDFLRGLFKGAPYVEAAYMTGILPVKKYGRHSALNLFREYTVTDPKDLAPYVGFAADEVSRLCERFGMDFSQMRRWYDGYLIGRPEPMHMYNPNSVACAIESGYLSDFWTSTETYEALQAYIDMDFDGVQADLVAMLDGQRVPVNVGHFENDMRTIRSKDDMYTLLVHLGYLGYDEVDRTVFIPNEEIRREFANSLETGARPELARLVRDSRELQRRTLEGDEPYVADAVARAHDSAAGPHYYNDEQALRAAVKLAYIWSVDDYLRVDELPGGRGYADIAFVPKPGSPLPPMVVELKWDRPAEAALAQIRRRDYPAALAGLSGECVLVGITYREGTDEHECRIERVALG